MKKNAIKIIDETIFIDGQKIFNKSILLQAKDYRDGLTGAFIRGN
ncbi:hypothetical protein [Cloacibacillus porcorum]|nr:hypothetical protein [Cloacibacillus porcorum]